MEFESSEIGREFEDDGELPPLGDLLLLLPIVLVVGLWDWLCDLLTGCGDAER